MAKSTLHGMTTARMRSYSIDHLMVARHGECPRPFPRKRCLLIFVFQQSLSVEHLFIHLLMSTAQAERIAVEFTAVGWISQLRTLPTSFSLIPTTQVRHGRRLHQLRINCPQRSTASITG